MKNILKKTVFAAMAAAMLASFVGCTPATDDNSDDNGTKVYSLSVDKESVELLLEDGASTVTVTTNGTYDIEVEAESVATATKDGNKITITPVAKGTTTVVVTCKEDKTKTAEIAVTVTSNIMILTLNLDEAIAIPGGSIVVKYGNGGDVKPEAYEYYVDANATVAEDGKSATVELNKTKASATGWFNGVIITVKDKDGNEIETEYTPWFEYNADGVTIDIKKPVSIMTVSLKFEDFTADSVKVTYGSVEKTTVNAVVAEDKKSATVEINGDYKNSSGYMEIAKIEVVSEEKTIEVEFATSNTADKNTWFKYGTEGVELTYKVKAAEEEKWNELKKIEGYGGTGAFECILGAGDLQKEITTLKVDYANMKGSGDWWIQIGKDATWDVCKGTWNGDISGYTVTTEDSDLIAGIKENGLYFVAGSGLTGDLIVYYK